MEMNWLMPARRAAMSAASESMAALAFAGVYVGVTPEDRPPGDGVRVLRGEGYLALLGRPAASTVAGIVSTSLSAASASLSSEAVSSTHRMLRG